MEYAGSSPCLIFKSSLILKFRWEYKRHASWVRLQPPCWPVYSIHGSVDRLLRQLGWHSRAFPTVTVRLHRDMGMCVWGSRVGTPGLKSPPLIIRPRCLLPPPGPKFLTGLLCGENKSKGQPGYRFRLQKTGSIKRANDNTDAHRIHIWLSSNTCTISNTSVICTKWSRSQSTCIPSHPWSMQLEASYWQVHKTII